MYESVIGPVAAVAALVALVFTFLSFMRLRKTEQVRLSESILRDVRSFVKEFTIISSETVSNTDQDSVRIKKLDHFLDQASEALDWYCFLIEIREINNKDILNYFKRMIIKWHDDFLVKNVGVELISGSETKYPNIRKVYQRFKREDKAKTSENKGIFKYFKFRKFWRLKISY